MEIQQHQLLTRFWKEELARSERQVERAQTALANLATDLAVQLPLFEDKSQTFYKLVTTRQSYDSL